MAQNQMSEEQMQTKLDELNAQEEIENAHVVEFLGNEHIHIDYQSGDIGIVSPDGSSVAVFEG